MSTAGFSSLVYLKSQLLAEALREDSSYDAQLLQLGLGVVGQFENFCQRRFARAEGITEIHGADRCQFLLERTPVESLTSIEFKSDEATGWETQVVNDYIRSLDAKNGIVYLPDGSDAGEYWQQLRFTYTGGYYIDTASDDCSGTPGAGQTALPADLRTAWLLQCKKIWEVNDPLGMKLVPSKDNVQLVGLSLAGLDLVPMVKTILADYVKFNMT